MSYELIIEQCSPTLAGIKTGSLFSVPNEDKKEFKENIKRLNSVLVPRGLRLIPVKQLKNRVLIYLYRPNRLKRDLENSLAENILLQKNYPTDNADRCVAELIKRLKSGEDFPHEVGLFLGYPAEDVNGFIKYGAKNAKYNGVWRVYGDCETAKKKFALYNKCTGLYKKAYSIHNSFNKLIVSC